MNHHPATTPYHPWLWLLLLLIAAPLGADTLDTIRDNRRLVVGVRTDHPPFGFLGPGGEIIGFEVDIARALAEALGVTLELQPVTSLNRPAILGRGGADLVIASLVDRPHHRREALLVQPGYYASGTAVLSCRCDRPGHWSDLAGREVCGIQGSLALREVRKRVDASILGLVSTPAALSALQRRRCSVLVHDSSVLLGVLQREPWRTDFMMPLSILAPQPWRMAVAPGEERWAAWLGERLVSWHRQGKLLALEGHWGLPASAYLGNLHLSYEPTRPHP